MFVFDKISGSHISTHQFEITGSTYAPEGEVWVFHICCGRKSNDKNLTLLEIKLMLIVLIISLAGWGNSTAGQKLSGHVSVCPYVNQRGTDHVDICNPAWDTEIPLLDIPVDIFHLDISLPDNFPEYFP